MKKVDILIAVVIIMAAASCKTGPAPKNSPASSSDTAFLGYAVGKLSVVQLNTKPDWAAESATQTLMGMTLTVRDTSDGWLRVTTPEGYAGWCPATAVERMDAEEFANWLKKPKAIATANATLMRIGPSAASEVVGDIVMGDILERGEASADAGGFISVSTPDGRGGFVPSDAVEDYEGWTASRNASEDNIVATALQFVGFPYVWGGTSAKGMDCSGFTKTVYLMNGLILKRDASQQVKTGTEIDISRGYDALRPGDLVFFGREASGDKPEKISHVALYTGDGRFLHASGRIRLSSLDSLSADYYDRKPLRARRIIGNADKDMGIVSVAAQQAAETAEAEKRAELLFNVKR